MESFQTFNQNFAGELGRVYHFLGISTTVAAEKLFDLHQRHSVQVGRVMLAAMGKYAEERRTGRLPDTCVVSYAFDGGRVAACPRSPIVNSCMTTSLGLMARKKSASWHFLNTGFSVRIVKYA